MTNRIPIRSRQRCRWCFRKKDTFSRYIEDYKDRWYGLTRPYFIQRSYLRKRIIAVTPRQWNARSSFAISLCARGISSPVEYTAKSAHHSLREAFHLFSGHCDIKDSVLTRTHLLQKKKGRRKEDKNERTVSCLQFIKYESFDQLPVFSAIWKSAFLADSCCHDVIAEDVIAAHSRHSFPWFLISSQKNVLRVSYD